MNFLKREENLARVSKVKGTFWEIKADVVPKVWIESPSNPFSAQPSPILKIM
jgi:hypothetical protein